MARMKPLDVDASGDAELEGAFDHFVQDDAIAIAQPLLEDSGREVDKHG